MPCNCPAIRNYTALVQGLSTAAITHIANAVVKKGGDYHETKHV